MMPAVCAVLLALLGALQLALTNDVVLPAAGWSGGGARASMPAIGSAMVPPVLQRTSIFSPERTAGSAPADGPELLLGGSAVAGSVSVRGRSYAVIVRPDGSIVRLPIGGIIAGKRLVGLGPDSAVFVAGAKRIQVNYGAIAAPPAEQAVGEEQTQ